MNKDVRHGDAKKREKWDSLMYACVEEDGSGIMDLNKCSSHHTKCAYFFLQMLQAKHTLKLKHTHKQQWGKTSRMRWERQKEGRANTL
jgi:hypothetical protein